MCFVRVIIFGRLIILVGGFWKFFVFVEMFKGFCFLFYVFFKVFWDFFFLRLFGVFKVFFIIRCWIEIVCFLSFLEKLFKCLFLLFLSDICFKIWNLFFIVFWVLYMLLVLYIEWCFVFEELFGKIRDFYSGNIGMYLLSICCKKILE